MKRNVEPNITFSMQGNYSHVIRKKIIVEKKGWQNKIFVRVERRDIYYVLDETSPLENCFLKMKT